MQKVVLMASRSLIGVFPVRPESRKKEKAICPLPVSTWKRQAASACFYQQPESRTIGLVSIMNRKEDSCHAVPLESNECLV